MCKEIQLILTMCWNPAVLRKIDKTSKNCYFGAQVAPKSCILGQAQNEEKCFKEITKVDHQLSEIFHFIKIS